MSSRFSLAAVAFVSFFATGAMAASPYAAPAQTRHVVTAQSKPAAAKPATTTSATSAVGQRTGLRVAMRKLWEDHITYTRNYIISALGKLPDTDAVAARLMKNQEDIGNAVKPFFGESGGAMLTSLLKDHISIATDVVKAAMANDSSALDAAQMKWSANGKQIADFLASANPDWDKGMLEAMLQKHLDLTTGEVTSRLKMDWNGDIGFYDQGHEHMMMFADVLSEGIIKQFPKKFTS